MVKQQDYLKHYRQAQLGKHWCFYGLCSTLPEQQLLGLHLTPAINIADIAGTGQRQGAGYLAEAGMSGLETQAQTEIARANLLGQIYSSMLSAPSAQSSGGNTANQLIGGLFGEETLGSLFSSIFGKDEEGDN